MHMKIKLSDQINFVSGQNLPLDGQMTCSEKKIICWPITTKADNPVNNQKSKQIQVANFKREKTQAS